MAYRFGESTQICITTCSAWGIGVATSGCLCFMEFLHAYPWPFCAPAVWPVSALHRTRMPTGSGSLRARTKMNQIEDIIAQGAEIRAQLRALLDRHEYPGNTKNLVLTAYVDIALERHAAIWLLCKSKLHGSGLPSQPRLVSHAS